MENGECMNKSFNSKQNQDDHEMAQHAVSSLASEARNIIQSDERKRNLENKNADRCFAVAFLKAWGSEAQNALHIGRNN